MPDPEKRFVAWKVAVSGLGLGLFGFLAVSFLRSAEESASVDRSPAPPCPVGFLDRVGHAQRVRARLQESPEGAALLGGLTREIRLCFGEIDVPVVSEGRVLILDARPELSEQAARAGHLLHHIVEGMPYPSAVSADTDCDEVVETAIAREAAAHALEVRLRRAFDLAPSRYDFEPAFWAAPETERVALIERYLHEHPRGARNMDPLAAGYGQRCAVERDEAGML